MNNIEQLVLVTGLSGAGKSSALHYLEDLGFYWIDNLPCVLIPQFLAYFAENETSVRRVAIGIHIRNEADTLPLRAGICTLIQRQVEQVRMVFLDANFDILVNRFRETRRRHPAALDHTIAEAIEREAVLLEPVRAMADIVIDTTRLTVPALKDRLNMHFQDKHNDGDLLVFIRSFGFKYGSNTDADMVLDGRFLANPYYDAGLRPLCGLDAPICRFLEQDGEATEFLNRLVAMFDYLIPHYRQEKKRSFTVDIGCTGGRHRSVYLVERLAERLKERGFLVYTRHRDLKRVETAAGFET